MTPRSKGAIQTSPTGTSTTPMSWMLHSASKHSAQAAQHHPMRVLLRGPPPFAEHPHMRACLLRAIHHHAAPDSHPHMFLQMRHDCLPKSTSSFGSWLRLNIPTQHAFFHLDSTLEPPLPWNGFQRVNDLHACSSRKSAAFTALSIESTQARGSVMQREPRRPEHNNVLA